MSKTKLNTFVYYIHILDHILFHRYITLTASTIITTTTTTTIITTTITTTLWQFVKGPSKAAFSKK